MLVTVLFTVYYRISWKRFAIFHRLLSVIVCCWSCVLTKLLLKQNDDDHNDDDDYKNYTNNIIITGKIFLARVVTALLLTAVLSVRLYVRLSHVINAYKSF